MAAFEVGKSYEASDPGLDPVRIINRTDKTVTVYNGHTSWMMRIKVDSRGDEFVQDSSVGRRVRDEYLWNARWSTE